MLKLLPLSSHTTQSPTRTSYLTPSNEDSSIHIPENTRTLARNIHGGEFNDEQFLQLRMIIAMQNARIKDLESRLAISEKNATMDSKLTDLLNNGSTLNALTRRLENGHIKEKYNTLLYIDLDFFKKINDGYGHATADLFLHATADILTKYTREGDIVGRLGGDELSCTISHDNNTDGAIFANRILDAIRNIQIHDSQGNIIFQKDTNVPLKITASIGSYTFLSSQKARSMSTSEMIDYILRKGDIAMYRAKHTGKNQVINSHQKEDEILCLHHLEEAMRESKNITDKNPHTDVSQELLA